MADENLNPKQKPAWATSTSDSETQVVGIDLTLLSPENLDKLIILLEEIEYTPIHFYKKGPGGDDEEEQIDDDGQ